MAQFPNILFSKNLVAISIGNRMGPSKIKD